MKYNILNTHTHNIDGIAKVTGRAEYTFDITRPGMLYGKILRSPHPHAKIKNIDYSKALELSGVKGVVTGKDTLGMKQGIWRRYSELCDEQILPMEKVRYIGEPVAAVAAVTEEIAEAALDLIEVDYEVLPAVYDAMEGIKKDAPIIHEGVERNINVTRHIEWGDVEEGFEQSDYIREDWFKCSGQAHMCMETRDAVAEYTPEGKLTVWTSTQAPYYIQALLAGVLGLKESDIRVISHYTGGGFGGKFELDGAQFCASVLSMKLYKPVKIVYTREEDLIATKCRTPMYYYTRTGVKKDGTFMAREARVFTEGGAYTSMGATALYLTGFFHSFPYKWKGYRYDGYRVYTNTIPATSMRGFGAPQATFCSETQIDLIAKELGIDRFEIRRMNGHTPNYEVPGPGDHSLLRPGTVYRQDRRMGEISRKDAPQQRDRHFVLRIHVRWYLQLVRYTLFLLIRGGDGQLRWEGRPSRGLPGNRPGFQYHHGDDLRGRTRRKSGGHPCPLRRYRRMST